jgi:uncharacterized protein (DUF1778 family)
LNIRTSEAEYKEFQKFASFQGKTLSRFALDAMWAQIEDWEDRQAMEEYEKARAEGTLETRSWSEVLEKAGLS